MINDEDGRGRCCDVCFQCRIDIHHLAHTQRHFPTPPPSVIHSSSPSSALLRSSETMIKVKRMGVIRVLLSWTSTMYDAFALFHHCRLETPVPVHHLSKALPLRGQRGNNRRPRS